MKQFKVIKIVIGLELHKFHINYEIDPKKAFYINGKKKKHVHCVDCKEPMPQTNRTKWIKDNKLG